MKPNLLLASIAALALASTNAPAELLFTQYYEGASNNKWVELTNVGDAPIDLSIYSISVFANANAEAWKTSTTAPTFFYAMTGTLGAGATLSLGHPSAALPNYAIGAGNSIITGTANAVNFNGNDSAVLYLNNVTYGPDAIVDVLSFTTAGNEGQDLSFVRTLTGAGFNFTAGSNITDFPEVWQSVSLGDVNGASPQTNNYIGYSTLVVPEPGTVALIGLSLSMVMLGLRRRRVS